VVNREIEQKQVEIEAQCHRYQVQRLDLFGSAATGGLRADSDIDLLVDFGKQPNAGYAARYFDLLEALESLFQRPVDLVVASAVRNPYLRQSIEATKTLIYAA
jgi:predicted nucleotidyltransferase